MGTFFADRKCKSPFCATPPAAPAARRRTAARGWGWTGAAAWGRGEPREWQAAGQAWGDNFKRDCTRERGETPPLHARRLRDHARRWGAQATQSKAAWQARAGAME